MKGELSYYTAYGLTIESEFDLSELPSFEKDATDVTIRRESLEPVAESADGSEKRRIESEPDRCRLTYESVGTFLVEDGDQILCDPDTDDIADQKIFRRIVENQILAVLLLQRELLVLHGSAVVVNGEAVVFLGERTAGKSTTAAAFYKAGYPVLGDDVIAIDVGGDDPRVVPGVPQIRLSPDAIDGIGIDDTTQPAGDWGPEKRYQDVDPVEAAVPLGGIYLLRDGDRLECGDLSGQERFRYLTAHTYAQGLLRDSAMTTKHFEQCSTVLAATQFRVLKRPKRLDVLPELVEFVAADTRV